MQCYNFRSVCKLLPNDSAKVNACAHTCVYVSLDKYTEKVNVARRQQPDDSRWKLYCESRITVLSFCRVLFP
jgi:hypothetical protein